MSNRNKSAKDIAWDREREKFRRQIDDAKKLARQAGNREESTRKNLEYRLNLAQEAIKEQEGQIEELTKLIGIDRNELLEHIKRVKELKSSVDGLNGLGEILGGLKC